MDELRERFRLRDMEHLAKVAQDFAIAEVLSKARLRGR
jgi:hypothetical protein